MSAHHLESESGGGFEYDSGPLPSPVQVSTSFAQNSVLRLRGAVVTLIRERTRFRQGETRSCSEDCDT